MKPRPSHQRTRLFWFAAPLALCVLAIALWTWWAEQNPGQERELRILVHERLQEWFPEQMALPEDQIGFIARAMESRNRSRPEVLLLHGLDEPGNIWDDLVPALAAAGINVREFRYPNDQAIDQSADLLAEHWQTLAAEHPVVLLGHSMGGLVIRDFVSRWRHPVGTPPAVEGAAVQGVILVGTPNQGSEWTRLRIWLELRELMATIAQQRFSLFAGLQNGTGAAKIDLRPDSAFLAQLNARNWPEAVPIRIIGGRLTEPTPAMMAGIDAILAEFGSGELAEAFEDWWSNIGESLGDGVVPLTSLAIAEAPPPIVVSASHRSMLVRTLLDDDEPPAIAPILAIIAEWAD